MMRLIKNEFIKTGKYKIMLSYIILIIVIVLMDKYSSKSILDLIFNLIPFIGIIVSILYSGTICNEIESGTFRYYLTKPFKRWKIYLSKYICILLYITITIIIVNNVSFVIVRNIDINILGKYFIYSIPIYFIGTLSLYLSTKFKSQAFCVGLCVLLLSFSLIISQVLFGYDFNFIEYTFMPYLDYSIFNDKSVLKDINNSLNVHLSLNRGIIIDFIFIFMFYFLGNYKFNKKDIKN